jgi:hypothetical protein
VLPFLLAFVAIPFEYLISSGRTVFGALLVLLTRGVGLVLRMASNLVRHLATALVMIYDVLIFLPLLVERAIRARSAEPPAPAAPGMKKFREHDDLRKTG